MKALNRSYGVALVLLVLLCSFTRCKLPGGPFVTVTIVGIPKETTKLVMTAVLGEVTNSTATTPPGDKQQLTLNLRPGDRGSLKVSAEAAVSGTSCMLAKGDVTVELVEDVAYETTLQLVDVPLEGCQNVPTLSTVSLKLVKIASGGANSVVSNPAGIDCATATGCTQQVALYRKGSQVKLSAHAPLGSQVTWSESSCSALHVCAVTMDQDKMITATFAACPAKTWCDEGAIDVTSDLYGVWGISSTEIYTVGDAGTIELRSGSQWTSMASEVTVPLRAVGGERTTKAIYVGGDNGTLLNLIPPYKWAAAPHPALMNQKVIGIAGDSQPVLFNPPNISVYFITNTGGFYSRSGTNWNKISDDVLFKDKVINGISSTNTAFGREAEIVGDAGFLIRYSSSGGQRLVNNTGGAQTTAALRGVWSGGSFAVAVGDGGIIITTPVNDYGSNPKAWTLVANSMKSRLNAVWGGDDQNVWIVGDGGVILKFDGNKMVTKEPNVPPVDLFGVWAADGNQANVYAVGRNGTILHYQP